LKRWRQSVKRRDRNRSTKSRTRTLLTRAVSLVGGEPAESEAAVKAAVSALDKAAQKGVIHANAAARGKSRLLKRFNLAQAQSVAAAAGATQAEGAPPARGRRAAAEKPAKPRTTRGRAAADKPADDKTPRGRTRRST
jgi:small subunit ribosomal protein S20